MSFIPIALPKVSSYFSAFHFESSLSCIISSVIYIVNRSEKQFFIKLVGICKLLGRIVLCNLSRIGATVFFALLVSFLQCFYIASSCAFQ